MASTAHTGNSLECDYLSSHPSPIPHVSTSEQAELVHINEQISSPDHHIPQLNSRQLHNLLLPIHTLPIEVLSHIFQQTIVRELHGYAKFKEYRKCLHQAFVLSSVSAHFRHVAFCTPALWRRIPLNITSGGSIGQLGSLLRHCMSFTPSVDVAVKDRFGEGEACSVAETLLTSEVTRSIKTFDLISLCELNIWTTKLKGSSFPMLDSLGLFCEGTNLDLQTLHTVTRLEIGSFHPYCLIIMPPSVRYLFLHNVQPQTFVSTLYHCPNLEEYLACDREFLFNDSDPPAQFNESLTLTRLRRLTLKFLNVTMTPSSAQNLRLPSLEYLRYKHYNEGQFDGFLLLCHNVMASLTTLKIEFIGEATSLYDDHLYQLCRLPFPNLRKLGIANLEPILSTIRVLTRQAEKCNKAPLHYLPSLTTLTLRYDGGKMGPCCLLDLLEKWRVGETSHFHLKIKGFTTLPPGDRDGPLEVEEKLRSIVGDRQIRVTWNGRKVQ